MSYFSFDKVTAANVVSRADYFENEEELAQASGREDYYFKPESGTLLSAFVGGAKEDFGLKDVQKGDYLALFRGINPRTGEDLVDDNRRSQIKNASKIPKIPKTDSEGEKLKQPKQTVLGFSTSIGVDKSISLLYAVSDRPTQKLMEEAMMRASANTIDYMERHDILTSREGTDGVDAIRGKVAALNYLHFTSRPPKTNNDLPAQLPDPHLHVHIEIPNIMVCSDGKIRTLYGKRIYESQHQIAAAFDTYLAIELAKDKNIAPHLQRELGVGGLVIAGISKEKKEQFSARRKEIMKLAKDAGSTSAALREGIAKRSRDKKDDIDIVNLMEVWKEKIGVLDLELADNKAPSKLAIESELFKNRSIFSETDLTRVAAQLCICGEEGPDAITRIRKAILTQMEVVDLPVTEHDKGVRYYTTAAMVEMEADILRSAVRAQRSSNFALTHNTIQDAINLYEKQQREKLPEFAMRPEQRDAIFHVCGGEGVSCISGAAGVGKSVALASVNFAYTAAGFNVIGCSTGGVAAAEIEKSADIPSQTIHSLLIQILQGKLKLSPNDIVVLDEAGMVDTRLMHAIFMKTQETGAKLILAGDEKQLESITSANVFSSICRKIHAAKIIQISRQTDKEDRKTSEDWFHGRYQDALARMRKRGQVHAAEDPMQALLDKVAKTVPKGDEWKNDLILADKNDDVDLLNDAIREIRKERGELGESIDFRSEYQDRLARDIELSVNDRIMLRDNAKIEDISGLVQVFNGDRGTIESFNGGLISVRLDRTGELVELPADYEAVTHAYAMTVHKSQGLTVDRAYYLTSEITAMRAAYVAFTRAKAGAEFFCSNAEGYSLDKLCSYMSEKMTALHAIPGAMERIFDESDLYLPFSDQPNVYELLSKNDKQIDLYDETDLVHREKIEKIILAENNIESIEKILKIIATKNQLHIDPLEPERKELYEKREPKDEVVNENYGAIVKAIFEFAEKLKAKVKAFVEDRTKDKTDVKSEAKADVVEVKAKVDVSVKTKTGDVGGPKATPTPTPTPTAKIKTDIETKADVDGPKLKPKTKPKTKVVEDKTGVDIGKTEDALPQIAKQGKKKKDKADQEQQLSETSATKVEEKEVPKAKKEERVEKEVEVEQDKEEEKKKQSGFGMSL